MALADSASRTALKLIAKHGKTISVSRVTVPGAYDTATGTTSEPTVATVSVKAYVKDCDSSPYRAPNVLVKTGDKELLIAASGFSKPDIGDTFTVGGVIYTIVPVESNGLGIQTVSVGETDVLYKVHGRAS